MTTTTRVSQTELTIEEQRTDDGNSSGILTDAAFERTVLTHRGALTLYARQLTRNAADAEDLVQETLLRAYANRHTLRESGAVLAWLRTTLRNLNINQWRKRAHIKPPLSLEQDSVPEPTGRASSEPEASVLHRMGEDATFRAIAKLPEAYRLPLVLADIEGLRYDEIAARLEVPVGTVRSRISRARQRLQRSLFAWYGYGAVA
jgi:RNA polymerase sigma-70 factor, ECF subfamily